MLLNPATDLAPTLSTASSGSRYLWAVQGSCADVSIALIAVIPRATPDGRSSMRFLVGLIMRQVGGSIFEALSCTDRLHTVGTILAYVAYWLTCIATLVYMKWSEGRTTIVGRKSAAYQRREERKMISAQNHHVRTESSQPLYSPVDDSKKVDYRGTMADERILPEIGRIQD